MPRSIVYPAPAPRPRADERDRPYAGGTGAADAGQSTEMSPGDGFAQRLLKYIPAETLAFVVFLTAMSDLKDAHVVAVVVVGLVGQVLILRSQTAKMAAPDRPTLRFFIFAVVAYLAWVVGTSPRFAHIVHLDRTTATLIMACVAYLLPLIDPKTHEIFDPKPPEPAHIMR